MTSAGRRTILSAALIVLCFTAGACARLQADAAGPSADPAADDPAVGQTDATAPTIPARVTLSEPPVAPQPADSETYLALGKRLLSARQPEMAMNAFLRSMGREGITAEAMTGAGIAAQQQGLLTAARRYFEQASKMAPDSVIAHNNLGVVLFLLKEYYPARNEFRTAYALSSGKSAMAERNLNRAELVIASLEKDPMEGVPVSHNVVRLGTSEFRLIEAAPTEADATAE